MQPSSFVTPVRGHSRAFALALLLAVGCAGSGSSCGSSCGAGVFKTTDAQGKPFKYTGDKLDNVATVRVTQKGFDFLNAGTLNDLLTQLNSTGGAFNIPCFATPELNGCLGGFFDITKVKGLIGDSDFSGACEPADQTPINLTFKDVTWSTDPVAKLLKAKIIVHIASGAIYFRTAEAHSSLCAGTTPIQARVFINDEPFCPIGSICPQKDTEIDLDLAFRNAPDGRLEITPTNDSLDKIMEKFNPAAIQIDGGADLLLPAPPATGHFEFNGCDSAPNSTYSPYKVGDATKLACSQFANILSGGCSAVDPNSLKGLWCQVFESARTYLLDYVKNQFRDQIVALLRTQIDNARCVRSTNSQGDVVACDATHGCPADDDGNVLTCDTARGVCYRDPGQNPASPDFACEPTAIAIAGQLDVSGLSQSVGFPAGTKLNLFAGLGGKTATPAVDATGLQLSGLAGTQPASATVSGVAYCVPPVTFPPDTTTIPALNFNDAANQPTTTPLIGENYEVGFALASNMLNRGFYDAFNAGMLCLSINNQTSAFVSTGLFKTFLPSLGLLAGGRDAPMQILLRPTTAPSIRIGKGTLKQNADGTYVPDDPLITLTLNKLDLDFYALIDERQVRLFTLEADVSMPLGLRTFPGNQADTLQPVLGSLATVLTNITAKNNEMLAEDPAVLNDLIGAAIQLAQPLLAGALKPITLPNMLGLDFQVRGIGGAMPLDSADLTKGYHHLAIWAGIAICGTLNGPTCTLHSTDTEASIVARNVPADLDSLRGPKHVTPSVEIDAKALAAKGSDVEFSYRIDGALWSPWVRGPRFTVRDELFRFQGHHTIEVTSREGADDRTQDLTPVALDFLVSVEAPTVELFARNDGSVHTRASSPSSPLWGLGFKYKLQGEGWSEVGPARDFTAQELGGRGLSVQVIDEAGHLTAAHFGLSTEDLANAELLASGCSSSPGTTAWALVPLVFALLLLARRKRA